MGNAVPSTPETKNNSRLRRLDLPVFKGNIRDGNQWWGRFELAVNQNSSYDKTEKLQYFHDAMDEGPDGPREYLSGFSLTPENYEAIIQAFKTRYSNTDLLSQAYQQDLLALPVCHGKWQQQRSVLDNVVKIVHNLNTIKVPVNEGNIRTLIIQKFLENTILAAYFEAAIMQICKSPEKGSDGAASLATSLESLQIPVEMLLEAVRRALLKLEFIAQAKSNMPKPSTSLIGRSGGRARGENRQGGGSRNGGGGGGGGGKMANPRPKAAGKQTMVKRCVFCSSEAHRNKDCTRYKSTSERKDRLIALGRCFICLAEDHISTNCTQRRRCQLCNRGFHHSSICTSVTVKSAGQKRNSDGTVAQTISGTFLQTFLCVVIYRERSCTARGVCDNGSDTSYVCLSLLSKLGISPQAARMHWVQRFGVGSATCTSVQDVSLTLVNSSGGRRTVILVTTDSIVGNSTLVPPPQTVARLLLTCYTYSDPDIFTTRTRSVEILLGSDVYYDFVQLNGHLRVDSGIVLLRSFFGWIPAGCGWSPVDNSTAVALSTVAKTHPLSEEESVETEQDLELSSRLEQLWSLEALGVHANELNDKYDAILESFRETTRIENGRYVVRWPRIKEDISLPTNYQMSVARLKSTWARLSPKVRQELHEYFMAQENEGVIERAPHHTPHVVHYLPYKILFRKDKMRVVYDASAKTKSGLALNDVLHKGPSLVKDIVGIFFGFRMKPTALLADVEKAFLRMGLDLADRDMVRFLAMADPSQPFDAKSLVVYRFCRVPFGVISSPFLLNMVFQELLAEAIKSADGHETRWCALAQCSLYVDNLTLSVDNAAEAIQVYDVLTHHFREVGFNLRDWSSNSIEFTNAIPPEMRAAPEPLTKVLGLYWDQETDRLSLAFDLDKTKNITRVTKRVALTVYAEVYDPFGAFAPCVLNLKLFIQEC